MQHRSHDVGEVFFALCKSIDSPVSLGAWLRFKHAQSELPKMKLNPDDYLDFVTFRYDYAVVEFLSKYKGLTTGVDTEAVALQRFALAEDQCKLSNQRIRRSRYEVQPSVDPVIHLARRKIARLLGRFSAFCVDGLEGWGPGATLEISRRRAALDTKMCELPITVSREALPFIKAVIERDLHWSASLLGVYPDGPYSLLPTTFKVVDACRITTVPKNAKTDRVIAIEPRGNGFLQKGVGRYIRGCLKRVSIDLDDQTRNQELAKVAVHRSLATIDLSMASDTVCKELVYELLPWDWASFLDDLRSRRAVMPDGKTLVVEKFSSMGNGFTFELETLIFWALVQSVEDIRSQQDRAREGVVSVYGDDIICQSDIVPEVMSVLSWAGFAVNVDKTFSSGQFRESCGRHYFGGEDVTPCYQKEVPDTLQEKIRMGNRLIRLAGRFGFGSFLDKRIEPAWRTCRRLAPEHPNPQIPYGTEGDDGWSVVCSEFDLGVRSDPNRGLRCLVTSSRVKRLPARDLALLAWTLRRGVRTESPFEGFLTFEAESCKVTLAHRWCKPVWEFRLDWR